MFKNKTIILLLVFFVFTPCVVFASWSLGDYVDDFGDETGEHFIFTTTEGIFSNSATSNSTSPMRIIVEISGAIPQAYIEFQPHAYGWNNPVEEFYNNSTAVFKFKDDSGNITTINTSNSEYAHNWNLISSEDAVKIINLFRNNKTVKISIKIESFSFNYTIDCSDFMRAYSDYFPSGTKVETGKWSLEYANSSNSSYDFCSASISLETSFRKNDAICTYHVQGRPDDPSSYPSLSFTMTVKDLESGLYYTPKNIPGSAYGIECDKISFTVGKKNYTFESRHSIIPYYGIREDKYGIYLNSTKLYEVLKSGETLVVDLYTTEGDCITIKTSASEFLKYVTYPY